MFLPGPGSRIPDLGSRIPNPWSNISTKRGGGIFFFFSFHFLLPQISKIFKLFYFWTGKVIFLAKTLRIIVPGTFYQKICHLAIKNMGLWSRIRKTYSGSQIQGQKGTGSRIPPNTALSENCLSTQVPCFLFHSSGRHTRVGWFHCWCRRAQSWTPLPRNIR